MIIFECDGYFIDPYMLLKTVAQFILSNNHGAVILPILYDLLGKMFSFYFPDIARKLILQSGLPVPFPNLKYN